MSKPANPEVKSVDAATEQEHIPGSMLLPMSKFDAELFPRVPGKTVVLHCAVGKRSESAGKMLLSEGHSGAVHLSGGIEAWKARRRFFCAHRLAEY